MLKVLGADLLHEGGLGMLKKKRLLLYGVSENREILESFFWQEKYWDERGWLKICLRKRLL